MFPPQARYFPVTAAPLKMAAGLHRLGTDFGEGRRDACNFQRDVELAAYLAAKRAAPPARHLVAGDDREAVEARAAALRFLRDTLAREAPDALGAAARDGDARDELEAVARAVQEDVAVLSAGEHGDGRMVALDVRFPSGWRPERLADASFAAIHVPVPGFADKPEAARSMVRAMVERGPYVRFVWTLSADHRLDHHPDAPKQPPWSETARVLLRVERQVTAPLPEARASVFLIRTYQYDMLALTPSQQATIGAALDVMPSEVRAYKGLPTRAVLEAALVRASLARAG